MATNINYDFDPRPQFLTRQLTQIKGRPTQLSLRAVYQELKTNLRRIYSPNGCGTSGLLHLFYNLTTYNVIPTLVATPFVDPVHPGAAPNIPAGATTAQINCILQEYGNTLNQHIIQANTDKEATEQLMAAVNSTYYQILEDPEKGYADLTLNQLITHLNTSYGEVTTDDLNENEKRLEKQWRPSTPLEDLWTQAQQARAFAANHDPISKTRLIQACTKNLEESGIFDHAFKQWRAKAAADKTWSNVQIHFNEADKERLRSKTTGQYAANQVKTEPSAGDKVGTAYQSTPLMYYCWSHGFRHNCKNCLPGHKTEATFFNMVGRCNYIHRLKDEKQIWSPKWTPKDESNKKLQDPAIPEKEGSQ